MVSDRGTRIIEKAKEMGATRAGIASVELLKDSPSHKILNMKTGLEIKDFAGIKWPEKARSALIIAFSHPLDKPELDWFDFSGSPGNNELIRINKELSEWIEKEFGIKTHKLPYSVQKGGIYLKDTAVLAGLGCIGKNNLLVTPELGPRVRLRGMLLEDELSPTGPVAFDPCDGCEEPCKKVCPRNAFGEIVVSSEDTGMGTLPGRDGCFSRPRCFIQMDKDVEEAGTDIETKAISLDGMEEISRTEERIKPCRQCEFACPVGS
jgi:epoxyqueuosine reductase